MRTHHRVRSGRWLAGSFGFALALALSPVGAQAAVTTSGSITLVDTDPLTLIGAPDSNGNMPTGTPDDSTADYLITLVNNTPAGADLYAAFYNLQHDTGHDMATAIENAATRGVNVHIVIDHKTMTGGPHNDAMISELEGYPLTVTACADACAGTTGIAHSKFFLFSSTVDPNGVSRTDVVANGSQNMTHQQTTLHNNFVISYDDPDLYSGFLGFWNAMNSDDANASNPAVSTPVVSSTGVVTTYFFPRSGADDVVAQFVDKLDCTKGGHIYGESSSWDSDRTALNDALESQSDAGCAVTLIMDDTDGPTSNDGTPASEDALPSGSNKPMNANVFALHGITVYGETPGGCRYVPNTPSSGRCHGTYGGEHEKYLVISGTSTQGAPIGMVMSGSENFTQHALTLSTNATMQISDPTIVQGFIDDFNRQLSETLTINPDKYPSGSYSGVNSAPAKSQDEPSVARTDGYTAVAWADSGNPTTAATGKYGAIYVKLMRADGTTVYEAPVQQQAVELSGSDYRLPAVGIDSSGNVFVAWQDDDDGNGSFNIFMRKVTNNGTATPVIGSRIRVNANAAGNQTSPSLAMTAAGDFSVAWTDDSSGNLEIRLATFDATGSKIAEMQANGTSTGTHNKSSVAVYPAGGTDWTTVVVWRDDSDGNGSGNIHGRAVTSTGAQVWAEKALNSNTGGDQLTPKVSANANGFVVAWESDLGSPCHTYGVLPGDVAPATDTSICVEARSFDATGVASAPEFVVSDGLFDTNAYADSTLIGDQTNPSVAIDDAGDYVVAWQELTPAHNGWEVYARSFTAAGGSTADTLSEYRMNPIVPHDQFAPAVASDGSGNFVLVYDDDADENGSTQLFERDGFTIG